MRKVVLLIEIAALIGAIAWFSVSPSWEPAVTALIIVAAVIGGCMKKDESTKPESAPAQPHPQPITNINVSGSNAVVSSNQSGGITAQNVIINPPASASNATLVIVGQVNQAIRPDGTCVTTAHLRLETPFPVGNLLIEVHGESIQEIDVNPMRAGVFMTGHSGNRPGYSFTNIPNASGDLELTIRSLKSEQFQVAYAVR